MPAPESIAARCGDQCYGTSFPRASGWRIFTKRSWIVSGLEMLPLGALAAAMAYGVGDLGAMTVQNAGL